MIQLNSGYESFDMAEDYGISQMSITKVRVGRRYG